MMLPYLVTTAPVTTPNHSASRRGVIDGRTMTVKLHPAPLVPRSRRAGIALLASLLLALPRGAQGADAPATQTLRVMSQPASTLRIEGTSTLHPFTSETHTVTAVGVLTVPDGSTTTPALVRALRGGSLKSLDVTIPVAGLKSETGGLDKNLYKALKSTTYPRIRFLLSSCTLASDEKRPGSFDIKAKGTLTIAGKDQEVTLLAAAQFVSGGVRITGKQPLKMTDYGIKPPTMMLGTVKAGNDIVVVYDLLFAPDAEASK